MSASDTIMAQQGSGIRIKTAQTVFDIIETLVEVDGATVTELTERLEKPTSTVHDHLQTLEQIGFVTNENHIYHISTRLLELGSRRRRKMDIYNVSKPELHRLADETGEHASLMIEENGLGVLLSTAKGENAVQVPTYSGARSKLHMTAPGKAILANLPDERVDQVLTQYGLTRKTRNTITSRSKLDDELAQIREVGYAVDRQELFEGMRAVGAPIMSQNQRVLGAISVYGPVNRIHDGRLENDIPNNLLEAANVIEVNMNYS